MKKIIITTCIFILSICSASATSVYYGNTGRPAYVVRGGYRTTSLPVSSAHIHTPNAHSHHHRHYAHPVTTCARPRPEHVYRNNHQNIMDRTYNRRTRMHERTVHAAPVKQPAPMSRFDRNYSVTTRKMYTRNGVTYYN